MSRPFIEFVQAQALPWREGVPGGVRSGVTSKVLSGDSETGATSMLVRYPPGWIDSEPHWLDRDEEFFVIAGDLRIGQIRHRAKTYAHLPAGYQRGGTGSVAGAVALTFFSGEPARYADSASPDCDESRLVEFVDALAGEWGANFHPLFPPGAGRKFLRRDPHDGEETWVLGTMPLRNGRRPEKHPVVEEMFLLSGELFGHVGVMQAGAYFWRPPEEWHGPFGSQTGNLMLFRTKGGPLSTVYTEEETEFSWTPEHRPILPPELQAFARPEPGCLCY
jgi:uncharacterized protein DUF4437